MTVSSTSNRKTFTGDGVTVAFGTSPVVFFDEGDLKIYTVVTATGVATLKAITTHYTVSGGAGSTGTVTMLTAPAVGETLVIVRELDLVQEVDFVNNEATDAEVAEDALDKLTMMAQQLSARLDRSFVLPDSDVSGASTELPTPDASKLIGWDSAGTALANYAAASIVDTIVPTAFMETLLDDASAAVARATLDAQQDVFTTRGDLVRAGASGVAERVALGSSGQVLTSNGTDAVWGAVPSASDSAVGGLEIAVQSEVEAASSATLALTPGRAHFHPGVVKAWCYFTVSGGTPALEESYNVTSITDSGVGDYTINFTNALETAEYAAVVNGVPVSNGTNVCMLAEKAGGTRTTTAYEVKMVVTGGGAGGDVDTTRGSVVIYGNMP